MKLLEVEVGHVPQCPIAGDAIEDRQDWLSTYSGSVKKKNEKNNSC